MAMLAHDVGGCEKGTTPSFIHSFIIINQFFYHLTNIYGVGVGVGVGVDIYMFVGRPVPILGDKTPITQKVRGF
jgi:hypothetical protein